MQCLNNVIPAIQSCVNPRDHSFKSDELTGAYPNRTREMRRSSLHPRSPFARQRRAPSSQSPRINESPFSKTYKRSPQSKQTANSASAPPVGKEKVAHVRPRTASRPLQSPVHHAISLESPAETRGRRVFSNLKSAAQRL